jgi:FkbM family methyltransferase
MALERAQRAFIRQVALRRRTAPLRFTARFARAFLRAYGNWDYDPESNGERRVLEVLGRSAPRCFFDVGANAGAWTQLARGSVPSADVHCFEIVPDTARDLERNVAALPGVTVNAVGMSDRAGTVSVRFYPGASELSGIDPLPLDEPSETRECPVTTGDLYCRDNGIDRIDLLKVDVEGAEREVLRGFSQMLAERSIAAVQFEYGLVNIRSHVLLADFHELFESAGFVVGKIFPDGVDFRAYEMERDEDFTGPNYLAVQREREDLIDALRGSA